MAQLVDLTDFVIRHRQRVMETQDGVEELLLFGEARGSIREIKEIPSCASKVVTLDDESFGSIHELLRQNQMNVQFLSREARHTSSLIVPQSRGRFSARCHAPAASDCGCSHYAEVLFRNSSDCLQSYYGEVVRFVIVTAQLRTTGIWQTIPLAEMRWVQVSTGRQASVRSRLICRISLCDAGDDVHFSSTVVTSTS